jgi:hypothetical protein
MVLKATITMTLLWFLQGSLCTGHTRALSVLYEYSTMLSVSLLGSVRKFGEKKKSFLELKFPIRTLFLSIKWELVC